MSDVETWTDSAFEVLGEVAKHENGWITPRELMREVTERTGVESTQTAQEWSAPVLDEVADRCRREDFTDLTVFVGKKNPRRAPR